MLKKLTIEQFVIIDKLDLDFESGLTIFTGETGAGKSIILGAMGLVLGEPSNTESIRQGHEQSVIEAQFLPAPAHPVWAFLTDKNYIAAADQPFTIHRTMKKSGADDIRINDKSLELEQLKEIGTYLVEIHGQFANQSLLGPANQLNLLDLAGNFPPEILKNVADALQDVKGYKKALDEEKTFLARHQGLILKKIEDAVRKFDSVDMKEGFIAEIKEEYATLLTAKETMEAFQSILGRLIAGNGVVVSLSAAKNTLESQKNLEDEKMVTLKECLNASLAKARDAVEEMNVLVPQYEIDLGPLDKCKKTLGVLKTIAQEAKIQFDELEAYYLDVSTKLKRVQNGRDRVKELNDLLIESKNNYRHHAHILTEHRIEAAKKLSESITAEFAPLKLMKAEFIVEVEEKPDKAWTPRGFNEVTFTARMNPGMPFSPISETASGGELARMILALKVVLQRVQTTPTLVFDEVDTGIGGAAAAAVGDRIGLLAESTQVLVITHSPQVASRGDQHLHISKKSEGDNTISSVRPLSMDERIDEISRMLAGDEITDQSQAAAKSLIDEAAKTVSNRRQGTQV